MIETLLKNFNVSSYKPRRTCENLDGETKRKSIPMNEKIEEKIFLSFT